MVHVAIGVAYSVQLVTKLYIHGSHEALIAKCIDINFVVDLILLYTELLIG